MLARARTIAAILPALVLCLGIPAGIGAQAADDGAAPVVVELFTSQGCSSCPTADAFLGKLAERKDVLPFSMHVDYWNYMGWTDPYAREKNTARQKAYMHALGTGYVYTPQMVIDGETHVVGSDQRAVDAAIEAARNAPGPHVRVAMHAEANGKLHLSIPASRIEEPASIILVAFDRQRQTEVTAGENTGRSITNYHVVRDFSKVGTYEGKATALTIDPQTAPVTVSETDGCAVLLQSVRSGTIIGAGMTWLRANRS
ncbi:MAG: DUF1223 domain-containing protein [Alphaproteobacteria bacterium]